MSLIDVNTGAALTLQHVHVSIDLCSAFSHTRLILAFHNDRSSCINEAEFVAVLRDGSSVSGYAKEVDGHLVDAVVVPKEKGRAVFAAETRTAHKHKTSVVGVYHLYPRTRFSFILFVSALS